MKDAAAKISVEDDAPTIEQLIRSRYDGLSPSDRKLSDVIVAHQKNLASYSATELAQLAGVSKASAARYFKRLGYQDFNEFRSVIRARVSSESPLFGLDRITQAGDRHPGFTGHVENDIRNLASTLERLGSKDLNKALALLKHARRIWVVGYRNGYATAFYAHALFSHAQADVTLINEVASKSADVLADLEQRDVLFAVDFRRRTRLLPKVVRVAREAGASVVLLTYAPLSEVASLANVVLPCSTHGMTIFDSYVAAMSIVNYLGTELVTGAQASARKRMQRIERIHELLEDLDE
ncbi:MAG TPA: MurR/RpiR family transcriptional regulator [Burkholderiaceae bacterium]|jgi:DNA-binding MurR/RpiR family transcriptional regulator|nr:MurR/RpiR family transcriptional regulator [Burkholderiaceae bacterium]